MGPPTSAQVVRVLGSNDVAVLRDLLSLFARGFGDAPAYLGSQPDDAYLADLLARESFVAIAAFDGDTVVGGLAGYLLRKFEQARSECYLYDLAVDDAHRRRGVATALIERLRTYARQHGCHLIFVQADHGDDAAIALYTKLGRREDVLHFDIDTGDAAAAPPSPRLTGISPRVPVRDVERALAFYVDQLGLRIGWQWGAPVSHSNVFRDAISLDLIRVPAGREGTAMLYVEAAEVEALHAEFARRGLTVAPPADRDYGMRDFEVVDPDGNRIAFGQATAR